MWHKAHSGMHNLQITSLGFCCTAVLLPDLHSECSFFVTDIPFGLAKGLQDHLEEGNCSTFGLLHRYFSHMLPYSICSCYVNASQPVFVFGCSFLTNPVMDWCLLPLSFLAATFNCSCCQSILLPLEMQGAMTTESLKKCPTKNYVFGCWGQ